MSLVSSELDGSENEDSKSKDSGKKDEKITRVLIVSSIDISLLRFRGNLIKLLIKNGYEVYVVAPEYGSHTREQLEQLGACTYSIPMSRSGLSFVEDWGTYRKLKGLLREKSIDLIFPYTIKPVMYSSLAGRSLSIPVVGLVNGLGYIFTGNSPRQRLLRAIVVPVYRYCVAKNRAMIFQNTDDQQYYDINRLLSFSTRTRVVSGSGIDLEQFPWREPRGEKDVRFCFVGRLLTEKGILLFMDASKELKKQYPNAEFHVYGEIQEGSPNSITMGDLQSSIDTGMIIFHGRVNDIASELRKMDVIVCPSWYREGVPRSLLEALSVGLVVITTDTPGCRETVQFGVNGWLVPPRNLGGLVEAMEFALTDIEQIVDMSKNSRSIAAQKFNDRIVNNSIFEEMGKALTSSSVSGE